MIIFGQADELKYSMQSWGVYLLLEDALYCSSSDIKVSRALQMGIDICGLDVELLDRDLGLRVADAIRIVARATADGKPLPGMRWQEKLIPEKHELYQRRAKEIADAAERFLQNRAATK
ncbi:hypothetical protein [Anatilimnocola floriformis]|uniref:hypothetical protein n=1 Tax=Anatilimnocola floriformis TaxID=2948575 RepID=UPI0020C551C5|nr:hypothetical protein [Anatilimnocola floriformis]